MSFRFVLKQYVCGRCRVKHTLAVRTFHCGRLDPSGSPNPQLCYACQLAQAPAAVHPILIDRYRLLWRVAAAGQPLPPELQ